MFGRQIIRESDLKALRDETTALRAEVKGFYAQEGQTNQMNEVFMALRHQLRGIDCGKISGISREDIKNAYEEIAPVNGVVNYIADAVGDMAKYIELYDVRKQEYVENHWILDLLSKPNDRFTGRRFLIAWSVNKCLFGDAFTYAPKNAGIARDIKEMYVLPGHRVAIEKGGLLAPFKGVRLEGESIDMENRCFQSFDYNLDPTSFFGTSKIAAAAVYLTVLERSMNREATSLKNGGPANLITPAASSSVPALPQQVDDLEQKLNAQKNRNANLALRLAVDVHQLGDKPVDLNILGSHDEAINVLCFLFKLPYDLYKGQAKYENAKEAKKTVYEQIAIPMANEFCEDLLSYAGLAGDYDLKVNPDRIEVLKQSRSDVLDTLTKMHASLNELREANGYEPVDEDWADKPIMPMGVMFGNEDAFDISEE